MKALTIANHPTKEGDFCFAVEGEIAVPPIFFCHNPDCGCDRSHAGLNSHAASTALRVANLALDYDDIVAACTAFVEDAGWADTAADCAALANDLATASVEVAADHAVGTVLRPVYDHDTNEWCYYEEELT